MNGSTRLRNALVAAATVLSLGFGVAQAFATPQAEAGAALTCAQTTCFNYCRSRGFMSGMCEAGVCECYGNIQP